MTLLEKHIVALLKEKDDRAISLIYDQYAAALYGIAIKMVKNEDAAKDVLQESLIKIWNKADSFDPQKAQLFTWLFQVTRNTALDALRKSQRKGQKEIQIQDRDVYPIVTSIEQEDKDLLSQQVNSLDIKFKEVLDAIFFKGLTHIEAAEQLDLPLGTLKTRLRNALIELRTKNIPLLILLISCVL